MISTIINRIPEDLPLEFQPNPLVNSNVYANWSNEVQPANNVNTGSRVWCQEPMMLSEQQTSMNQKLTGLADPKTLVQPIISIPIYDNTLWKSNDFMVPKGINDQRRQELWQNGYLINDLDNISEFVRSTYTQEPTIHSVPNNLKGCSNNVKEDFSMDGARCMNSVDLSNSNLYPNNSSQRYDNVPNVQPHYVYPEEDFNRVGNKPFLTEFGYYPENEQYNLPTNSPAGKCEARPELSEYNKSIYTTTLQPGVYTTSQVNQPDASMANMGISYTQPFLPTYSSYVQRRDGVEPEGVMFTQYDPNFAPPSRCNGPVDSRISESDIYDGRFTGYGTAYRGYVDELTGRPKYFYDDVDEQRRNKFLTRNALDTFAFGLNTGPQDPPKYTNMQVREMAQNAYLDNQISYRTELQQRLMTKDTNRRAQIKKAPIITNQFNRGGSSAAKGITTGYAGPRG